MKTPSKAHKLLKSFIQRFHEFKIMNNFLRVLYFINDQAYAKCETPLFIISYNQLAIRAIFLEVTHFFDKNSKNFSIYKLINLKSDFHSENRQKIEDEVLKCSPVISKIVKHRHKIIAHTDLKCFFEENQFKSANEVSIEHISLLVKSLKIIIDIFILEYDFKIDKKTLAFIELSNTTGNELLVIAEKLFNFNIPEDFKK